MAIAIAYPSLTNASHPSKDAKRCYLPDADAAPVPGYDAWLADELAAGIAYLESGEITSLKDVRKEFGLE